MTLYYDEHMNYKRYYREGPGEMPPLEYATSPEELRTLTDEETAAIVNAKNAAIETQDTILKANQAAAESEGQLNAMLESAEDIAKRLSPEALAKGYREKVIAALRSIDNNPDALPVEKEWVAKIRSKTAMDTGDLRALDDIEMLRVAREAAAGEDTKAAMLEQHAETMAGTLKLMRDDEVDYSIANERRLAGAPDEVIEVATPEWLKDDPEFATKEDPNAMRLVETDLGLTKSIENQRSLDARTQKGMDFIEVTAPAGSMDDAAEEAAAPELDGEAEKERIKRVLGPSSTPRVARKVEPVAQGGLLARIKGWFGAK